VIEAVIACVGGLNDGRFRHTACLSFCGPTPPGRFCVLSSSKIRRPATVLAPEGSSTASWRSTMRGCGPRGRS